MVFHNHPDTTLLPPGGPDRGSHVDVACGSDSMHGQSPRVCIEFTTFISRGILVQLVLYHVGSYVPVWDAHRLRTIIPP